MTPQERYNKQKGKQSNSRYNINKSPIDSLIEVREKTRKLAEEQIEMNKQKQKEQEHKRKEKQEQEKQKKEIEKQIAEEVERQVIPTLENLFKNL